MATMQGATLNDTGLLARADRNSPPLPHGALLAGGSALDRLMASPAPLDRFAPPPTYTIRRGDTLSAIAARFGTDVATLARSNGIADPDRIMPGQTLRLPQADGRSIHVVQPGDTLGGIARAAGTSWQSLARLNGIADPDVIAPGMVLTLHGEGGSRADVARAPVPVQGPVAERPAARPADGAHRLGSLSERYETSGRGPGTVSSGVNDPGGVSYGVYQLSTNAGTLQSFLRIEGRGWAGALSGTPGSAGFSAEWRAIAAREPQAFREAQHAFIERTHYQPAVDRVRDATGLDLASRHDAVRDATWSAGVQHGRAAQLLTTAIERTDATIARDAPGYDRQLIQNIYAERTTYLHGLADSGRYSAGEAQQLRDITRIRYPAELRDALAMIDRADPVAQARAPAGNGTEAGQLASIIERQGDAAAQADLAAGRKVLVAIRADTATGANGGKGTYDDRMALVWRDGVGTVHARAWEGNTEPAGRYAARGYGVDVDGDGRKELGRLVEGSYRYTLQSGSFAGNRFFRAETVQPALRDNDHDGRFTPADRVDPSGAGRSLLIHQGGNTSTGSAGCQTLRPDDFNAFLATLGGQTRFSYVLVRQ
ncbi:LysM peptidoglycan-binding domain-containing protein [Croceibacterium mercuriale]|uniref:LysM peptidoglycan-binding domain-containing protein n=1 Tax=Croceibacterium mercuriale TaxID=1572751 RepID=UPI0006917C67|nr:LysM domain-containing protein [Croceibacterium mercuriale]